MAQVPDDTSWVALAQTTVSLRLQHQELRTERGSQRGRDTIHIASATGRDEPARRAAPQATARGPVTAAPVPALCLLALLVGRTRRPGSRHCDESARCLRDRRRVSVRRSFGSVAGREIRVCLRQRNRFLYGYQGWRLRKSPATTCRFCSRPEGPSAALGGREVVPSAAGEIEGRYFTLDLRNADLSSSCTNGNIKQDKARQSKSQEDKGRHNKTKQDGEIKQDQAKQHRGHYCPAAHAVGPETLQDFAIKRLVFRAWIGRPPRVGAGGEQRPSSARVIAAIIIHLGKFSWRSLSRRRSSRRGGISTASTCMKSGPALGPSQWAAATALRPPNQRLTKRDPANGRPGSEGVVTAPADGRRPAATASDGRRPRRRSREGGRSG
ncbi:hypothetical protein C7M84_004516 [Penaeus vannamei]|uniref:Uncharacterized protein n=1 Tax=Penaeus vannamei TaxID=6689 RepID=A0A3R7QF64_PENVA|nr:hypothetical protein C7M84_004516 [Penaeus vannamei]